MFDMFAKILFEITQIVAVAFYFCLQQSPKPQLCMVCVCRLRVCYKCSGYSYAHSGTQQFHIRYITNYFINSEIYLELCFSTILQKMCK